MQLQSRAGETSQSIPRQVQLARLVPLLGPGDRGVATGDGLSYVAWRDTIHIQLQAAGMLDIVDPAVPPPPDTDRAGRARWGQRDAVVYTSILQVVSPSVAAQLRQVAGGLTSSRLALECIRDLYWRPSLGAIHELEWERDHLEPRARETMVEFLTRAEDLRRRFETFAVPLEEWRLCERVFRSLPTSWLLVVGGFGTDVLTWSWPRVCRVLQEEDSVRRTSARGRETLFPCLGSEPRGSSRGTAHEASGTPRGPVSSDEVQEIPSHLRPVLTSHTPLLADQRPQSTGSASLAARTQFSPRHGAAFPLRSPPTTPRTPGGTPLAERRCFFCGRPGHLWRACPDDRRTQVWRPSDAQTASVTRSPRGTPRGSRRRRTSYRRS